MYVNIRSGGVNFTEPLPFQRFTGMYHDVPYASNVAPVPGGADDCSALCDFDEKCEFWKYRSTAPIKCDLFSSVGPEISGIKVAKGMRDSVSYLYSNNIPLVTGFTNPTGGAANVDACEAACNNQNTCGAYSYNSTSQVCTLYAYGGTFTGNVGASRSFSSIVTLESAATKSANGIVYANNRLYISNSAVNTVDGITGGFRNPGGISVPNTSNIFVADTGNNNIKSIIQGVARVLSGSAVGTAGSGTSGFSAPLALTFQAGTPINTSNIFIADRLNNRIAKINLANPTNVLTLIGGTTGSLINPSGVVYDTVLRRVFIADTGNNRIIYPTAGSLLSISSPATTVGSSSSLPAGSVTTAGDTDGSADNVRFRSPTCMTILGRKLYVVDGYNRDRIRSIDLTTFITTTISGISSSTQRPTSLGTETTTIFNGIMSITGDSVNEVLYVCDREGIKKVTLGARNTRSTIRGLGGNNVTEFTDTGTGRRYVLHEFTKSGTFIRPTGVTSFDVLVVAGGGGGGGAATGARGGGGGGGGVLYTTITGVSSNLSVSVGAGGTVSSSSGGLGTTGGDSSLSGTFTFSGGSNLILRKGGQGGNGTSTKYTGTVTGNTGGGSSVGTTSDVSTLIPPNGYYKGGNGFSTAVASNNASGGGGGAGGAASSASASTGTIGGIGFSSNITGQTVNYGGGGDGAFVSTPSTRNIYGRGGDGGNGAVGSRGMNGVVYIRYSI